jgi:hypothetical protein
MAVNEGRPGRGVDPDQEPIFVIGSGRSGTTLLRLMMNAHPRIYLTHEASFYLTPRYEGSLATGDEWLEWYFDSMFFAWLMIHPDLVRGQLPDPLPRKRLPDAYRAIMRAKASQYGRPRYGDKTPWHAVHLDRIFRDFPGAKVIHIVRDPRTAVRSFMRQPWGTSSYMVASWFYGKVVKHTRPYASSLHEVRLEDLLAEPEREMRRILEFVGEEWDEAVLDHTSHAPLDDVPPMPWFLPATKKRTKTRPDDSVPLPPAWVRMVEDENAWAIECFGYGIQELEREPGRWAIRAAYARDLLRALSYGLRFGPGIRKYVRRSMSAKEAQRFFFNVNPRAWKLYPGYTLPDPPDWRTDDPRVWRGEPDEAGEADVVLRPQAPPPARQSGASLAPSAPGS